ncbi:MAG: dihydrolipoamide acetyltransferase family protein, partial [bacterium]|nr:dihydrolipoamide acetyltransferase family protein [bacterium]
MARTLRMPEVLAGATEATITTWTVAPGDEFQVGTQLAEIETDKAVVDLAAEESGWIGKLLVPGGTTVQVGDPIAVLLSSPDESPDDASSAPSAASPEPGAGSETSTDSPDPGDATPVSGTPHPLNPAPAAEGTTAEAPVETGEGGGTSSSGGSEVDPSPEDRVAGEGRERIFASPLARKLAREKGIPLERITGTGPGGRIVRADVDRAESENTGSAEPAASAADATSTPAAPAAATDPASFEEVPHTRMRQAIARRLAESKQSIPHFYVVADCRMDALLELRSRVNAAAKVKISVNDFVLKAVAAAFEAVPEANVIWTPDAMRHYQQVDVAVAVSTETDLVTPVVRDLANLSLGQVAANVRDLAERARDKKLRQHELEGGTFTVSNLGMFGVKEFSAIINPPHSGILAVGASRAEAVVVDGEVQVAQVMTCTLSADHRAIDGALAARWMA